MNTPSPHITAIIPARYESTRLVGKVLLPIAGKAMLHHVYDRVIQSKMINATYVATDSDKVITYCKSYSIPFIKTGKCYNGTERIAEACNQIYTDIVLNVQADEVGVDIKDLENVIRPICTQQCSISTLCSPILNEHDLLDPNNVKVVLNNANFAIYFSRYPIPYSANLTNNTLRLNNFPYKKHIGIYCFTKEMLLQIVKLPISKLEQTEKLEQLRWIYAKADIHVSHSYNESISVDTQEDYLRAKSLFENSKN